MEPITKLIEAFQGGGLMGLLLLAAIAIIFLQQRQIAALVKQIIALSSTTGSALSATASSLTGLTDAVRDNGRAIESVNLRGARLESEITHAVEKR